MPNEPQDQSNPPNPDQPNAPSNDPSTPDSPNKPIHVNSRRSKESWSTFSYESILAFDTIHDVQFLNFVQLDDRHACFAALTAQSILGHLKIYATSTDQFMQVHYNGYTKKLIVLLDEHTLVDMEIKPPKENDSYD